VSFDEEDDLGDVAPDWRHRSWWDDHGAEDDIGSLLMLSLDRWVQLFEDQDFEDTQVDIRPSPTQFWIGIPDFRQMGTWIPGDAAVASGEANFNDEAHSVRFQP